MKQARKFKAALLVILASCATSSVSQTAEDRKVLQISVQQMHVEATSFANSISKSAPMQIDSSTKILGAMYISDTKTFFYRYQSSVALNLSLAKPAIIRHTCSSPVRAAYMTRGLTFRHEYLTPVGTAVVEVRRRDCP